MALTSDDQLLIRRYLLGNVTDEEQRTIEHRLLIDDDYLSEIGATEEDLIDEYARDHLPPGDRLRFERHFLSAPGRTESVAFARVLNACVLKRVARPAALAQISHSSAAVTRQQPTHTSRRRVIVHYVSTIAALLLALGVGLLLIDARSLRRQIGRSQAEMAELEQRKGEIQRQLDDQIALNEARAREMDRERAESSRIERELSNLLHSVGGPARLGVLSVTLLPGESRGADQAARVRFSPRIQQVRLSLAIEGPSYDRYIAEVQTPERETLFTRTNLRPQTGKAVVITLPARLLTGTNYMVRLSTAADGGQKILDTYFFTVVRK
jgi:hypothetical protein